MQTIRQLDRQGAVDWAEMVAMGRRGVSSTAVRGLIGEEMGPYEVMVRQGRPGKSVIRRHAKELGLRASAENSASDILVAVAQKLFADMISKEAA